MLVIKQEVLLPLRLQYEMILVFFFAFVHLCSLPLLHSATDGNSPLPNCRKSFSCPGLSPFNRYPFYKADDTECGLIQISCTSKGGTIQIGGQWYEITGKFDFNQSYDNIVIRNQTFGNLVGNRSCEALTDNFTSPSPLLYSIRISPFITLFKCSKNLSSGQPMDDYFKKYNYNSHNSCKDHNFYYNFFNITVPNDLPVTCQVVQLPVLSTSTSTEALNVTNIFSLLNFFPTISFTLSDSCSDCHSQRRQCDAKNGTVQCLEAIKEKQSRDSKLIKILAIAGSTTIFVLIFVIFIIRCRGKSNPFSDVSSKNKSPNLEDEYISCAVSVFSHKELEHATKNFDPSHELGDGGFGAVYYGKLKDGREVAVKKLHEHNYKRVQQFTNEVEILTKLRHPNLVVLYGCTSSQSRELLLVYEYVPNRTVADHLHREEAGSDLLTWPIRMKIAVETASALAYLHASEIIHRDVKTNNILLDLNFGVKVADFGLSRLIPDNFTHVSTAPQGTPGYVDPEYHQRYQLTDKSDVYSFGVVLIELISSMAAVDLNRAQDEISLANLALNKIQKCAIDELIDPVLGSQANPEMMYMIKSVAELAFRCLQYDSEMRPTMNEVVDALKDIQAMRRIDTHGRAMEDLHTMNVLPLSETNDTVVLLKDFQRSPVSVTGEWQSSSSASTTLSSNGDRLSAMHGIT